MRRFSRLLSQISIEFGSEQERFFAFDHHGAVPRSSWNGLRCVCARGRNNKARIPIASRARATLFVCVLCFPSKLIIALPFPVDLATPLDFPLDCRAIAAEEKMKEITSTKERRCARRRVRSISKLEATATTAKRELYG